jgi:hypothetical protein
VYLAGKVNAETLKLTVCIVLVIAAIAFISQLIVRETT